MARGPTTDGRRSSSSGRADADEQQRARPRVHPRYSIRSSSVSSAQCTSSKTSTSGRRRRAPRRACGSPRTSPRARPRSAGRPTAGASRSRISPRPARPRAAPRACPPRPRRVVLVDSRGLPHGLRDRPEGDALAVGQAAPAQHLRRGLRPVDELARAGASCRSRPAPTTVTSAASDRRRSPPGLEQRASSRSRPTSGASNRRDDARLASATSTRRQAGTGSALPLSSSGSTASTVDGVAHEPERRLAEQDLAGRGGLLEARRDVDRVAARRSAWPAAASPATTSPVLTPMRTPIRTP